MNFSEIESENENINLLNLYTFEDNNSNNYIDAKNILKTYKELNLLLINYKNKYENLKIKKEIFFNYQNNILNNHLNIINICSNIYNNIKNDNIEDSDDDINNDKYIINVSNSTEIFINYEKIIKQVYNDWFINSYKKKINKLENDIQNIELKINNFRKLFINIINEFINKEELINKKMCPICFDNEIDMCAIPCGHTCCNKCVILSKTNYINLNKCLNCRNPIDTYIKLYFLI